MRVRRLFAATLALALGLAAGGCGQQATATLHQVHDFTAYGGKAPAAPSTAGADAQALWDKHVASYTSCASVRIYGTMTQDKETATVNAAGTCDGSNDRVEMTIGTRTLEVITIAGTHYVKANAEFWRASGASQAAINAIGTKYLSTTDAAFADMSAKGLLAELKLTITSGTADITVEETQLAGQAAYKLVRGARTNATTVTVWVTRQGAVPLRATYDGPNGSADVAFSDWNAVQPFTAPPAAQVVKI